MPITAWPSTSRRSRSLRARTRWRLSPDRASASPRRSKSLGATASKARAFSVSRSKPEGGIKTQFVAGLFDCDRPVVIGDVVDAVAAAHREQRRLRCSVDMDWRLAAWTFAPGAGAVEQAIAQHDGFHAGLEHLLFHVGCGADRHQPRAIDQVERIGLDIR